MDQKLKFGEIVGFFSPHSNTIKSPVQILNKDAKVAEINDQHSRWWNIPLIEQIFLADVVEKIYSLAISPGVAQDRQVRAYTSNGLFTVQSAYYLELDRKACLNSSSSISPHQSPVWKKIWKLNVPRVVLLFLWRACNDILPTKEKLMRKIVTDPSCPLCGRVVETTFCGVVMLLEQCGLKVPEVSKNMQLNQMSSLQFLVL
jgi:hypothetical protein